MNYKFSQVVMLIHNLLGDGNILKMAEQVPYVPVDLLYYEGLDLPRLQSIATKSFSAEDNKRVLGAACAFNPDGSVKSFESQVLVFLNRSDADWLPHHKQFIYLLYLRNYILNFLDRDFIQIAGSDADLIRRFPLTYLACRLAFPQLNFPLLQDIVPEFKALLPSPPPVMANYLPAGSLSVSSSPSPVSVGKDTCLSQNVVVFAKVQDFVAKIAGLTVDSIDREYVSWYLAKYSDYMDGMKDFVGMSAEALKCKPQLESCYSVEYLNAYRKNLMEINIRQRVSYILLNPLRDTDDDERLKFFVWLGDICKKTEPDLTRWLKCIQQVIDEKIQKVEQDFHTRLHLIDKDSTQMSASLLLEKLRLCNDYLNAVDVIELVDNRLINEFSSLRAELKDNDLRLQFEAIERNYLLKEVKTHVASVLLSLANPVEMSYMQLTAWGRFVGFCERANIVSQKIEAMELILTQKLSELTLDKVCTGIPIIISQSKATAARNLLLKCVCKRLMENILADKTERDLGKLWTHFSAFYGLLSENQKPTVEKFLTQRMCEVGCAVVCKNIINVPALKESADMQMRSMIARSMFRAFDVKVAVEGLLSAYTGVDDYARQSSLQILILCAYMGCENVSNHVVPAVRKLSQQLAAENIQCIKNSDGSTQIGSGGSVSDTKIAGYFADVLLSATAWLQTPIVTNVFKLMLVDLNTKAQHKKSAELTLVEQGRNVVTCLRFMLLYVINPAIFPLYSSDQSKKEILELTKFIQVLGKESHAVVPQFLLDKIKDNAYALVWEVLARLYGGVIPEGDKSAVLAYLNAPIKKDEMPINNFSIKVEQLLGDGTSISWQELANLYRALQANKKDQAMEIVIQKMTEVGIDRVCPAIATVQQIPKIEGGIQQDLEFCSMIARCWFTAFNASEVLQHILLTQTKVDTYFSGSSFTLSVLSAYMRLWYTPEQILERSVCLQAEFEKLGLICKKNGAEIVLSNPNEQVAQLVGDTAKWLVWGIMNNQESHLVFNEMIKDLMWKTHVDVCRDMTDADRGKIILYCASAIWSTVINPVLVMKHAEHSVCYLLSLFMKALWGGASDKLPECLRTFIAQDNNKFLWEMLAYFYIDGSIPDADKQAITTVIETKQRSRAFTATGAQFNDAKSPPLGAAKTSALTSPTLLPSGGNSLLHGSGILNPSSPVLGFAPEVRGQRSASTLSLSSSSRQAYTGSSSSQLGAGSPSQQVSLTAEEKAKNRKSVLGKFGNSISGIFKHVPKSEDSSNPGVSLDKK